MSPEEIERAIYEIAWGGRFIEVRDYDGILRPLIVKSLSIRERNFCDFIYNTALRDAENDGVMRRFDLYAGYKKRGVWSAKDDEDIETLGEKIDKVEELIEFAKGREKKVFQRQLGALLDKSQQLTTRRHQLFGYSAETYAEEQRSLAIVFSATHTDQEEKIWSDWRDFLTTADDVLILNILSKINSGITSYTQKQIRLVARSNSWRFRWMGAKNIGDLFGKPICEFTPEQQSLLYWSQVYDSVYESLDRPPDSIIDDDEALDKWFEDQARKDKQKRIEESGDVGRVKMSNKMRGHGEIFIVANPAINPSAPDIGEIDELNTEFVRKFKQKERDDIKKHGTLKETELRKRGDRIARKIIGANDAVVSPNSFGQAKGGKKAGTILPGGSIS